MAARERLNRPAGRGAPPRPPAAPRGGGPPMRLPPPPAAPPRRGAAASADDLLGGSDGWDEPGGSPVSTASAASAFSSGACTLQALQEACRVPVLLRKRPLAPRRWAAAGCLAAPGDSPVSGTANALGWT